MQGLGDSALRRDGVSSPLGRMGIRRLFPRQLLLDAGESVIGAGCRSQDVGQTSPATGRQRATRARNHVQALPVSTLF